MNKDYLLIRPIEICNWTANSGPVYTRLATLGPMNIRHNFLTLPLWVTCAAMGGGSSAYCADPLPADADVSQTAATIHGTTRGPGGTPLPSVKVLVHGGAGE